MTAWTRIQADGLQIEGGQGSGGWYAVWVGLCVDLLFGMVG
jgi:hypothetical protein